MTAKKENEIKQEPEKVQSVEREKKEEKRPSKNIEDSMERIAIAMEKLADNFETAGIV